MKTVNAIIKYLDPESYHRSSGYVAYVKKPNNKTPESAWWVFLLYVCVWLGVVAKIYGLPTEEEKVAYTAIWWKGLVISVILATLVFPSVYKESVGQSTLPKSVRLAGAFAGGFGFKALVDAAK